MEDVRYVVMCRLLLCLLLLPLSCLSAPEDELDWEIEIVPSRNSHGKGNVIYTRKPLNVFYVVARNRSGRDLKLWRDWSPWGYNNLSFDVELKDGRKVRLERKLGELTKSYPDATLVKAGHSYVYKIELAVATWKGVENVPVDTPVKLVAVLNIKETPESKEKKVWTGKNSSEKVVVTLRR